MYNSKQVFAAACLALFLFGIMLITLGSILPALNLSFEALDKSLLVSILPVGIMLGSLIFGPIVDRYGYRLPLIISVLISAAAFEGLAFARSLAPVYACIFLIGFGGGVINGATNALVADISAENKGANLSLLGVSFGIGALGMPLLLGLLSKYWVYTTILAAVGLFMLLPVFYFVFIRFPLPKKAQGLPIGEAIKLVKEPALLLTGFFLFFQSGVENLVNNWTTSFLQYSVNIPPDKALYALSISVVGLTVTRLLLGAVLKKISSVVVMLVSLLCVIAGAVVLQQAGNYVVAVIALVFMGIGLAGGFPVILGYVGQLYAHLSGTAFSIALVIALTGNTLLNYLFGLLADGNRISYLPAIIIACAGCMLALLFIIKRKISGKVRF